MMVECVKCRRMRSDKHMEEAVFLDFLTNEGAGVYRCASNESCKKARKVCKKCGYYVRDHRHTDRWFDGKPGTYCMTSMGMGDPCGCEEYNE
jgi:hypothetical protein